MNSFFAVKFFGEAFITLLVITDPPGVVPPFLGLTRGLPGKVRARLAWQAAVVALGVILAFAVFGQTVLAYLGIEVAALQGAGGLLLLLVALQLLTGQLEEPTEAERARTNVAFVPLGTPLLAGPGAIVATMLFVRRAQTGPELAAFLAAILAVTVVLWLVMRFSGGHSPAAAAQRGGTGDQDRRPAAVGDRGSACRQRDPFFCGARLSPAGGMP